MDEFTHDQFPYSNAKITLSDGRVAVVVEQHHASPIERWRMWKLLTSITSEAREDGVKIRFRKRMRLRLMFLSTVLSPDCQACRYDVRQEA